MATVYGYALFEQTKKYARRGDVVIDEKTETKFVWDGKQLCDEIPDEFRLYEEPEYFNKYYWFDVIDYPIYIHLTVTPQMRKSLKFAQVSECNYVYAEFKDCRGNNHFLIVAEDFDKSLSKAHLLKQARSSLSDIAVKVDLNHDNYDNIYPFGDDNTLFLA